MSHATHANAALTPRARLRLARLIVDQGWSIRLGPPSAMTCPGGPRRSGPTATATRARPGWSTGPRAPHRQPNRTPPPVVRKIVHLRWKQRLGPVEIGDRLGMPASTVHAVLVRCRLNRLTHIDRATGEPIRRYEHEQPGDLIHVDVKKLGKVPDGGGWRYVGRQQGEQNRSATAARTGASTQQVPQPADRDLLPAHRDRRPLPGRLRRGPRRRDQGDRHRGAAQRGGLVRRTRRDRAAGPDRQRQLLPVLPVARDLRRPRHHARRGPGPTGPRPTARSNASTAPWPRAGHSRSSTTPNPPASPLCQHGSTSTTTTGPTRPSGSTHPSPGWTTWLDITPRSAGGAGGGGVRRGGWRP